MALPDERKFATFRRGKVRDDIILARFRNTLRGQINPDTKQPFTEDEIAIITQEDSRFFIEADAIDRYGQAVQQRAIWFADQIRPERAASGFLRGFHGALWLPDGLLAATGGSGPVLATGSPGTIYVGSTTLGDPTANVARDPSGKRYQVLITTVAGSNGQASLQMQAIDPGDSTNLLAGTVLTWVSPPLGTDPEASVTDTFTGGFNEETENEFAQRLVRRIRNKPGAGNSSQFRLWAGQATNAVADAFIYPTALHSGSVVVCVMQKRGNTQGPLARVASIGTLAAVTAYLIPPTSPVVPHGVHVLVVPINPEPTGMALELSMPRGSSGGWTDTDPWPRYSVGYPQGVRITGVTSQTFFGFQTDQHLPNLAVGGILQGEDLPSIMLWDDTTSRFEQLDILSLIRTTTTNYAVALSNAPSKTLAIGDILSPANNRALAIAESFEDYFDELGPSELVSSDDPRYVRAARFPRPDQEYPIRAGQGVIARLDDQLGGALADAELQYISQNAPTLPSEYEIIAGPNILTLGRVGIYSPI
jgi:hypothetical protein